MELEGFQEDVGQATRQRETLEREREEARTLLEQLNSEVSKVTVILGMFTLWKSWLFVESQV